MVRDPRSSSFPSSSLRPRRPLALLACLAAALAAPPAGAISEGSGAWTLEDSDSDATRGWRLYSQPVAGSKHRRRCSRAATTATWATSSAGA